MKTSLTPRQISAVAAFLVGCSGHVALDSYMKSLEAQAPGHELDSCSTVRPGIPESSPSNHESLCLSREQWLTRIVWPCTDIRFHYTSHPLEHFKIRGKNCQVSSCAYSKLKGQKHNTKHRPLLRQIGQLQAFVSVFPCRSPKQFPALDSAARVNSYCRSRASWTTEREILALRQPLTQFCRTTLVLIQEHPSTGVYPSSAHSPYTSGFPFFLGRYICNRTFPLRHSLDKHSLERTGHGKSCNLVQTAQPLGTGQMSLLFSSTKVTIHS